MKIKKFESFEKPDLRKMRKIVLCIKDFKKSGVFFNKGEYYKVNCMYGDPQGAVEKYGIYDYVPVELIGKIVVEDKSGNKYKFPNGSGDDYVPLFFDYFDIPDFVEDVEKYNLI